jgi:murein DD-endopeptidase MepM/ murein hydrolase activator NlpD
MAPPAPIGDLRIGTSRRVGGGRRRAIAGIGGLALLAGTIWALAPGAPSSARTPGVTARVREVAALVAATPRSTLGAHGDDLPAAVDNDPDARSAWQTIGPEPAAELTGYRWPIRNARLTNGFGKGQPGSFEIDGVTTHDGLDLATWCGDRIVAAHDGVVLVAGRHHEAFIGWLGDLTAFRAKLDADHGWRGQAIAVVVDDGNGYRSLYVHLGRAVVKAGQQVHAGELIGYEGATGNATGCHLHYGLFSPLERGWLALDPKIAARNHLPPREIARIDPLLVLPPLAEAGITWGWGAHTTP